jgi:hypothetical protein
MMHPSLEKLASIIVVGAISRRLHADVEVASVPCGLDVTVRIPWWRRPAYWQPVLDAAVTLVCPQVQTRVTVVRGSALRDVALAVGAIGIALFVWGGC